MNQLETFLCIKTGKHDIIKDYFNITDFFSQSS